MSDEPSFVKCPYCQRKLEKKPTRKSKCPHCGEAIYVRSGDLMRADELPKSESGTHTAGPKRKAKSQHDKDTQASQHESTARRKKTESKPRPSSNRRKKRKNSLDDDLKKKKDEKFSPSDLQGGIQLILSLLGKLVSSGDLFKMLGGLLGGGGDTRSMLGAVDTGEVLTTATEAYDTLDDTEQRQLRAVVTWVQNGFDLSGRMEG